MIMVETYSAIFGVIPVERILSASKFIGTFLLALGLSWALTRTMISLAPVFGLIDEPGERRIHTKPIPRAGGIAVFLAFLQHLAGFPRKPESQLVVRIFPCFLPPLSHRSDR